MGRPATTLSEVNYLVSTLTLTPHARPLVATARALARRIDAAEGTTNGAIAQAVPGLARALSDVLDDIVAICTANDPDPLLAYLNGDPDPAGLTPPMGRWPDRSVATSGRRQRRPPEGENARWTLSPAGPHRCRLDSVPPDRDRSRRWRLCDLWWTARPDGQGWRRPLDRGRPPPEPCGDSKRCTAGADFERAANDPNRCRAVHRRCHKLGRPAFDSAPEQRSPLARSLDTISIG